MSSAPRLPLDGTHEVVYRHLLSTARATTAEVAEAAALTVDGARDTLAGMADEGLVAPAPDPEGGPAPRTAGPESWVAVPPVAAFGGDVARLRADLAGAEQQLAELVELGRTAVPARGSDLVQVVAGNERQARRVRELERDARRSVDVFQSGVNTVAPVAEGIDGDDQRRDVAYRVVVDAAFLNESAAVRALDARVAHGDRVRVVDHPLVKLAVADGTTALMQVDPSASLVLHGPLVRLAAELFESTWRRSRPYLREGDGLSRDDRQLLQLLLAGLTDSAMASQLGSSPRTVQRRLRALMDTAEVNTRMQLGWYALRHDWV